MMRGGTLITGSSHKKKNLKNMCLLKQGRGGGVRVLVPTRSSQKILLIWLPQLKTTLKLALL